ncbi:MAG TPA: hypothetical protein VKA78_00885 [Pyrinomonadaceae bacterium]|nr:hypothetical protein [Pyrinomonadaceae bacterium]
MKRFLFNRSLLLVLCLLINSALVWGQSRDNNALLTNTSIVKLVKAGFQEKSIITIIASRPVQFDLSTDRIIELKRTGVSEKVILAMMARQEGNEFSDDAWGDEEFFNSSHSVAKDPAKAGNSNDGSSAEIFGSSGGSKGSTRTRNGSGSSSGDTVTTGSATVRILRPPTEAGGAPTKLEKTKSLTNDSICELVEAGFSEGTIIRRIEQSPVEFDLSTAKVEELRKRRVSEKILTAMKAAMGDESSK